MNVLNRHIVFALVAALFFFSVFEVNAAAPASWTCVDAWYDSQDGCDCDCGVPDPDCNSTPLPVYHCQPSNATLTYCDASGVCVYQNGIPHTPGPVPSGWTCDRNFYDTLDGCDCNCGAWDPDCDDPDVKQYGCFDSENCILPGVCNRTISPGVPPTWTCNANYYATNDGCDCNCGAPDPDCDTDGADIYGCTPGDICVAGVCQASTNPSCPEPAYSSCLVAPCIVCDYLLNAIGGSWNPTPFTQASSFIRQISLFADFPSAPACLTPMEYNPSSNYCTPYANPTATATCGNWPTLESDCLNTPVSLNSVCELSGSGFYCELYNQYYMSIPTVNQSYVFFHKGLSDFNVLPDPSLLNFKVDLLLYSIQSFYFFSGSEEILWLNGGYLELSRALIENETFYVFLFFNTDSSVWVTDATISFEGCPMYLVNMYLTMYELNEIPVLQSLQSDIQVYDSELELYSTLVRVRRSPAGKLSDNIGLHFYRSLLDATGTVFYVQGLFKTDRSYFILSGGSVVNLQDDRAELIMNGIVESYSSYFHVYGGKALVGGDGSTTFSLTNSWITMESAASNDNFVFVIDNAAVTMTHSFLEVFGGSFVANSTSSLSLDDTSVEVTKTLTLTDFASLTAVDGSSVALQNQAGFTSTFLIEKNASLDMRDGRLLVFGQFILSDDGKALLQKSKIEINDIAGITARGSSAITATDGSLLVYGAFTILDSATVSLSNTLSQTYGTFSVANSSSIDVSQGYLWLLDNQGLLVVTDQATSNFQDTVVDIEQGTVHTSGSATLLLNNSQLSVEGNMVVDSQSSATLQYSNITVSGGNFSSSGNSTFSLNSNSILHVSAGSVQVFGTASAQITASEILVSGGVLLVTDQATSGFQNAVVDITQGTVHTLGSATLLLNDSQLSVEGNMVVDSQSSATLQFSNITVSGGNFSSSGNSTFSLNSNSILHVSAGSAQVFGTASAQFTASRVLVSGGVLLVTDQATSGFQNAVIDITQGIVHTSGSAALLLNDSQLSVEGNMVVDSQSSATLQSSNITVSGGSFSGTGNSTFLLNTNSLLHISAGSARFSGASVTQITASYILVSGGALELHNSSRFDVNPDSSLSVTGGVAQLTEDSSIHITGSDLLVDGGSLYVNDTSELWLSGKSQISVTSGLIGFSGDATLGFDDSVVTVDDSDNLFVRIFHVEQRRQVKFRNGAQLRVLGGSLAVTDDAELALESLSSIQVDDGSILVSENAALTSSSSSILVSGGEVKLTHSSAYHSLSSTLTLVANGSQVGFFEGYDEALIDAVDSTISVQGGGLRMYNQSTFHLQQGLASVDQGSILLHSNSSLTGVASSLNISGGSLEAFDYAVIQLNGTNKQTPTVINGGSLLLHSSSRLITTDGGDITVKGGSLKVLNSSSASITKSTFNIFGGNVNTDSDTVVTFNSGYLTVSKGLFSMAGRVRAKLSLLRVVGGNVLTTLRGWLGLDRSTLLVGSGSITVTQTSLIGGTGANLIVSGGQVTVQSNGRLLLDEHSNCEINDGSLELLASSKLQLEDSKLSITGGDLLLSGDATGTIRRGEFSIKSGSVRVEQTAQLVIESSKGRIRGGNVVVQDGAFLRLQNKSEVKISDGQLLLSGQAIVQILDESFIRNGKKIVGGGRYTIPGSSGLEVTSEGVMELNEPLQMEPSEGEKEGGQVINQGSWKHSLKKGKHVIHVPFRNRGQAQFAQGSVSFSDFDQEGGSTVIDSAEFHTQNSNPISVSGGRFKGKGKIKGGFKTKQGGTLGESDDPGLLLDIDGDMNHDGSFEVAIEGTKPGDTSGNGFGQVSVNGNLKLTEGSEIVVCLKNKKFAKGTKFDVMKYKSIKGKFKSVRFECPKKKGKRDLEETEDVEACPPSLSIGGGTISVLIGGCMTDKNGKPIEPTLSATTYMIVTLSMIGGAILVGVLLVTLAGYWRPARIFFYGYDRSLKESLMNIKATIERQSDVSRIAGNSVAT